MKNNNRHLTLEQGEPQTSSDKRARLAQLLQKKAHKPQSFPVSSAQQRMWVLWQLDPNSPVYSISAAIRFKHHLDAAIFEQAINAIVARHETLRTTFTTVDDKPVQMVLPKLDLSVPVIDLSHVPLKDQNDEIQNLANNEAKRPFDLVRGPLLRAILVKLGQGDTALILNMHHIIIDGWSLPIFIREFGVLYQAIEQGQPSPLPNLPIQYVDYAVWQQKWLESEAYQKQLTYWKAQLAGASGQLELPSDRPRPARPTLNGATTYFELSAELLADLRTFSRNQGVTLYMTMMAAFMLLLYRYTGQTDITVGTPIANRNRIEVEPLIGFFVNTLVLRIKCQDDDTFLTLLAQVRDTTLGATANQDLPFDHLVKELQAQRDTGQSPLFQVMMAFQEHLTDGAAQDDYERLELDNGTTKFDLTLSFTASPKQSQGSCQFSTDLFDQETIKRFLAHFQTLLEAVIRVPDLPLHAYNLLPDQEWHQIITGWNQTQTEITPPYTIQACFEAQVERSPNVIALVFQGQRITYRLLNNRANQLAHYLQTLGVMTESLVGVCLDRSVDAIVAMLAILKAGGAYVPLDPEYPDDRLGYMLADSQVRIVITQSNLAGKLSKTMADSAECHLVCLDQDGTVIAQQSRSNPKNNIPSNALAYMIYTSGSTGRPKGTLLQHYGVCNMAQVLTQAHDVVDGSRVLQFASFSFDASVVDIFTTLLNGATLCLASQNERLSSSALTELLISEEVTTAVLPPSVLTTLSNQDLPALRRVISAGEACTAEIVALWAPGRTFLNGYGPTEATVCATVGYCLNDGQKPSIGRPIGNYQVYILDQHHQLQPIGISGELYIGGVGLAHGYHNRPDITAERFIPDPFGREPGGRLYKTGDLVRFRADGNIEYLGRIDHQVKIRGFRIEVEEIESALRQHPAIIEAAIGVEEGIAGSMRLIGYVVAIHEHMYPTQAEIRNFLWNQAVQLEVRRSLDPTYLTEALRLLFNHHDALRLRFDKSEDGWSQISLTPDSSVPFQRLDLSTIPSDLQAVTMAVMSERLQESLNLSDGPLVQVALFEMGGEQADQLLMIAHHLVVDGVSWRMLMEDLQTLYLQLEGGKTVQLPPKTTSYKQWAKRLIDFAQQPAIQAELTYWLDRNASQSDAKLPTDFPVEASQNTRASADHVVVSLSEADTQALFLEVPKTYNTQINDALLAALVISVREWSHNPLVRVNLEGHGREDLFDDVDLSRTVGWFTSLYPICFDIAGDNLGEILMAVKEELRAMPNKGVGFGILRYLTDEPRVQARLKRLPQPELSFNYLGQFDQMPIDEGIWGMFTLAGGAVQSPKGHRDHLLSVNGHIQNGQLRLSWEYSTYIHQHSTIEHLAQQYMEALRSLIRHCQSAEAPEVTPSDFPLARLDGATLTQVAELLTRNN